MFLAIYKLCFIFDNFRSAFICIVFFNEVYILLVYIGPINLHLNCLILSGSLYPLPPPLQRIVARFLELFLSVLK